MKEEGKLVTYGNRYVLQKQWLLHKQKHRHEMHEAISCEPAKEMCLRGSRYLHHAINLLCLLCIRSCSTVYLCAAVAVTRMLLTCSSQKKSHSHLLDASQMPCIFLPGSLMLIYLGRIQVTTHSCTNVASNSLKNSIVFVGDSSWGGVKQPSGRGVFTK